MNETCKVPWCVALAVTDGYCAVHAKEGSFRHGTKKQSLRKLRQQQAADRLRLADRKRPPR